jgi:hypothetical protein
VGWDVEVTVESRQWNGQTVLIKGGADARYVPTGHLLYALVMSYSIAVSMSSIARTSAGVSRWGDMCGQDD